MEIIENFPENLIAFLISPPLNEWLLMIRIIFIASSLLLIGSIIFALLRSS